MISNAATKFVHIFASNKKKVTLSPNTLIRDNNIRGGGKKFRT